MARQQETADSVIQYMEVPPDILDHQCTDEHLAKLSQHIHDWERIIGHLGFENARAIEAKIWTFYPKGLQQQTNAMFLEWKDLGRRNATYRRLIEVFVSLQNVTYAEKLCEIVSPPKGMDGSPAKPVMPPGPPPSTSKGEPREAVREENGREQTDSAQSPGVAADDVKILLVVINETENKVVKKFLKPPHTKLSRTVTLGKFGGHKVALIHTNMGDGCSYPVRKLLQNELQQVDKVIAIGVAGGAKKEALGDVLVSEWIECGDTTRVGKEVTSSRGRCVVTPDKLRDIFCKGTEEWSGKEFLCDKEASRYSKVHAGVVLSASILWDNKDQKERLLAAYAGRKFIGMEMEGKALIKAAEEVEKDEMEATGVIKRKIAVIVIKGVCDYGDGDKEKSWQPVAAEAAASYAEFKLQEFPASDGQ